MTKRFSLPCGACLAVIWVGLLATVPVSAAETAVITLTVRGSAQQRILLLRPDGPPKASVLLYSGGAGNIGIEEDGSVRRSGNFLVRSREHFAKEGFLVAVADRPSDWAEAGGDRYRIARTQAEDAAAIARVLRQEADVPVWLVGTSRGSISAANAASRLGGDGIGGVVLTSPVVHPGKRSRISMRDVDLAGIAVPVLILGHGRDGCPVTQWPEQEALVRLFANSPSAEAIRIDGGDPGTLADSCGPQSHHGFLGQEKAVVERIADWIRAHSR